MPDTSEIAPELTTPELIAYLDRRRTNWTNSKEITRAFRCHKRHVCKLVDEADGRIISSVNGYKLQDHATRSEVMQAYAHLTNLVTALQARASQLMTTFHHQTKKADPNANQPTFL